MECDVRVTKDGNVVVFHDGDLRRLCKQDIKVKDLNTSDLDKYKILDTEYTIPTLKQLLDLVDGRMPIMIELKPNNRKEHLEQKVYDIIKHYKGDLAIKSFNPFSVMWFKNHAPEIPRGMLASFFEDFHLPFIYKVVIKRLMFFRWAKPDFVSYDINNLPNKYTDRKSVPILTWTIQNEKMEEIALKHADNVIFENYVPKNPKNY